MKKLIRRLVRFILLIIMIVIAFIAYHEIKYLRIEKWHPKYFMTIQGKIDPKIAKEFRFFMDYASSKATCDDVNYIAGLRGVRIKSFDMSVPVDQSGKFTFKIPLDRYYSGFCGWEPDVFGLSHKGFDYGLIAFSNEYKSRVRLLSITCNVPFGLSDKLCNINNQNLGAYRDGFVFTQPFNQNNSIFLSIRD